MNDAKHRTELMVFDLYRVISKYLGNNGGEKVSGFVIMGDVEFMLCRAALNGSVSVTKAAELLMMKPSYFRSRLKKLGLWDCRFSELSSYVGRNKAPVVCITVPMAQG